MNTQPSVSVVIRCHNEEAHIGRLLTGLTRQRRKPDEIVVVDSGSTDATTAIASAFPVTITHIDPSEFSFGAACNVGVARSGSDLVTFVSAHCFPVYDTWLERLIAPFQSPEVALSYGKQVGPPEGRYSEKRLLGQWFPDESVPRQRDPFCNNANAAIRRAVWSDGIKYDEELTGLEDLDWAKRALDTGHAISYVAEAPVVHVHDEGFAAVVNRYQREAIAHRQIYGQQAMRLRQAVRLGVLSVARDYAAARREGELSGNVVDIPRFRAAQYLGTFRGFRQTGPVTATLKHRFYYPEEPQGDTEASGGPIGTPIDYDEPEEPDRTGS
jgi:hypothetical protein